MIDKKEFEKIREELEADDEIREEIIKGSRMVIKDSKIAIYSVHRGDIEKAESKLAEMKKNLDNLPEGDVGIRKNALQEYVEAASFIHYAKTGELITLKELALDKESYLLGICDLTGELMRMAVNKTIAGEYESVNKIRDLIDEIYGEFIQMNLPNSELRKKSDSIKWNLNKVSDLVLEFKLKNGR